MDEGVAIATPPMDGRGAPSHLGWATSTPAAPAPEGPAPGSRAAAGPGRAPPRRRPRTGPWSADCCRGDGAAPWFRLRRLGGGSNLPRRRFGVGGAPGDACRPALRVRLSKSKQRRHNQRWLGEWRHLKKGVTQGGQDPPLPPPPGVGPNIRHFLRSYVIIYTCFVCTVEQTDRDRAFVVLSRLQATPFPALRWFGKGLARH